MKFISSGYIDNLILMKRNTRMNTPFDRLSGRTVFDQAVRQGSRQAVPGEPVEP